MAPQYRVKPAIEVRKDRILIGASGSDDDRLLLGSLAESVRGKVPAIWLSTSKEQVVATVGKRGSGKSFTLGVLVEGLVATKSETSFSNQTRRRALLLFDPLDVYWTTRYPVSQSASGEALRHYQLAKAAGLDGGEFTVDAWIPGSGFRQDVDPSWFRTLELPIPLLGLDEWSLLLGVDMLGDPQGQACAEVLRLVREGWLQDGQQVPAATTFGFDDLLAALQAPGMDTTFHRETLRALRQRLQGLRDSGLFSAKGTPIEDLAKAGAASVILLGRLPEAYRVAIVAVLTRMLIEARTRTSFAEKRLALDPTLSESERSDLMTIVSSGVPRTVVGLDEAQAFLAPDSPSMARSLFIRLVKEGRNLGLSTILATQQPSALDRRVLSQVETFIAHQLVTAADIRAVHDNLKTDLPEAISYGNADLDFGGLLRQLPPGQCVLSAADLDARPRRTLIVNVRPRATVHGGIEL
jgi:hypothetical protein